MLLTLSPLPASLREQLTLACPSLACPLALSQPATIQALASARALLLPPDGLPVADIQHQPQRWEQLTLVQRARSAGLPILAWGNGAALLGRAAGGVVTRRAIRGEYGGKYLEFEAEVCTRARGMQVLARLGTVPALWQLGQDTALIDPQPSSQQLCQLLEGLPAPLHLPATPLEFIGGSAALGLLLSDFYAQCLTDPLLAPTFAGVQDWAAHLEHVQQFWETMLGQASPWRGNLNTIHAPLRVTGAQLERWLELFSASAKRHLSPAGAVLIIGKAQAMRSRLGKVQKT